MITWAESLGTRAGVSVDTKDFTKDSHWRAAWETAGLYAPAAQTIDIATPTIFLRNLEPDVRKDILLQYLRERYPESIVRHASTFADIVAAPAPSLGTLHLASIQSFLVIGQEMEGYDASATVTAGNTAFADVPAMKETVRWELEKLYRRGRGVTGKAYLDFVELMKSNPTVAQSVLANPSSLASLVRPPPVPGGGPPAGIFSSFATAVVNGIFTADNLKSMTDQYRSSAVEKERLVQEAATERKKIKNRIDIMEKRNFAQKMIDYFQDAYPWAQWAIGLGGAAATYLIWTKKYPMTWIPKGATLLGGYLLGRELARNTPLNDIFRTAEEAVGKGKESIWGVPKVSVDSGDEELRTYTDFIQELATEEVTDQLEAMGYISTISLGSIADSFTLSSGARTGVLNLDKNSPIAREVYDRFQSSGQQGRIMSRLRSTNDDLSDAMAHAFFMLGALSYPDDFHAVEELRAGKPYDDLPDGSLGRQTYEWLTQEGLKIAKTEYRGVSWLDVVVRILKAVPRPAGYPPSAPGSGAWRRGYPPSIPPTII